MTARTDTAGPASLKIAHPLLTQADAGDRIHSGRRTYPRGAHALVDRAGELGKVDFEASCHLIGGRVISVFVAPGIARLQYFAWYFGAGLGHQQVKRRIRPHWHPLQRTVERCPQQRPSMGDRHPPAGAMGATAPAGIDKPAAYAASADAIEQHGSINRRM